MNARPVRAIPASDSLQRRRSDWSSERSGPTRARDRAGRRPSRRRYPAASPRDRAGSARVERVQQGPTDLGLVVGIEELPAAATRRRRTCPPHRRRACGSWPCFTSRSRSASTRVSRKRRPVLSGPPTSMTVESRAGVVVEADRGRELARGRLVPLALARTRSGGGPGSPACPRAPRTTSPVTRSHAMIPDAGARTRNSSTTMPDSELMVASMMSRPCRANAPATRYTTPTRSGQAT